MTKGKTKTISPALKNFLLVSGGMLLLMGIIMLLTYLPAASSAAASSDAGWATLPSETFPTDAPSSAVPETTEGALPESTGEEPGSAEPTSEEETETEESTEESTEETEEELETAPPETQPTEAVTVPATETPAPTSSSASSYESPLDEPLSWVDYSQYLPVPDSISRTSGSYSDLYTYGGFNRKSSDYQNLYLTFTLATETGYTSQLLDVLASRGVKATFFITVNEFLATWNVDTASLLRRIANEGHLIACHGYTHTQTTTISDTRFINEILLSKSRLSEVLGYDYPLRYYSPPFENMISRDIWLANRLGLSFVRFSYMYEDLYNFDYAYSLNSLKAGISNGCIYQLHIKQGNVSALGDFIDYARGQGYSFLRLDQDGDQGAAAPTEPVEPTEAPPEETTAEEPAEPTEPAEETTEPEETATQEETTAPTETSTEETESPAETSAEETEPSADGEGAD